METEKIIKETQGGRDVFAYLFPYLEKYIGTKKKFHSPFREERTPSAHFMLTADGVWLFKDFGSSDKAMNAIDTFMKVNNCDFHEAVKRICDIFNISDGRDGGRKFINAKYSNRPALDGQTEGSIYTKSFSKSELRFLSPLATEDVVRSLGYESLSQYTVVKDGTEHCFSSYEGYPIFRRHCRMIDEEGNVTNECHKIYQPRYRVQKVGEPSYKFIYQEKDRQPDSIINGLYEIKQARDGGEKKINAVICCGERDAICVKSAGFYPIWFNSENHHVTPKEMKLIRKFVDFLYYIPDIDDAGKAAMWRMMKAYPELYVVLLPDDMKKRTSDQHKSMKDLRDWMELHPSADAFRKLLNTAHQYKIVKYESDNNKRKPKLSPDNMLFMLKMNGFGRYVDNDIQQSVYVRVENNKVSEVTKDDIRAFVTDQIKNYLPNERDAVLAGKALDSNIQDLPVLDLDFTSATANSQVLHTASGIYLINPEGIHETEAKEVGHVWADKVINHDVTITDALFEYEERPHPAETDKTYNHLIVKDDNSKFLQYVMKASCLHWLKLEQGEPLTPLEEYENNLCLQAWLFNIGHLAHRYQRSDLMIAICLHEYQRYPGLEVCGGTGKSFIFETILRGMGYKCVMINASDRKFLDKGFPYQEVDQKTDVVFYDECYNGFSPKRINAEITSGIQYEQKYKNKKTLSRKHTPKIGNVSNYDPVDYEPSTNRRRNMMPISHFFHAKDGYYFKDDRSISDFFRMRLMEEDYSAEDWNRDINAFMHILSFYLRHVDTHNAHKIEPPMTEFMIRKNDALADSPIGPWVMSYFVAGEHCNKEILMSTALSEYNAYRKKGGKSETTQKTFTKHLKEFCSTRTDMELNPLERCTDKQSRRIRHNNVAYLYLKTTDIATPLPPSITESELPF